MLLSSTVSSLSLTFPSSSPSLTCFNQITRPHDSLSADQFTTTRTKCRPPPNKLRFSSSENYRTAVEVAPAPMSGKVDDDDDDDNDDDASDIVRRFYEGINGRDLAYVEELIADNCVYEDLIFPRPFVGRKAIINFFKAFIDSISSDLKFVIDDISAEDSSAVGVTWHLDWKGKPFPFSKGCSFYRLVVVNGKKQIIYGRDCVEPAIKPGETALAVIRAVTWLLQQFPQLADRL